jgi:Na+/serine symporter
MFRFNLVVVNLIVFFWIFSEEFLVVFQCDSQQQVMIFSFFTPLSSEPAAASPGKGIGSMFVKKS